MVLKTVLRLFRSSGTTLPAYVEDVVSGARKSKDIKVLSFASEAVGDTLHLSPSAIAPKLFPKPKAGELSLYGTCKDFKYFDYDNAKFTLQILPKKLEVSKLPSNEEVLYISNFDAPCGTIAGFSNLKKALYTDTMAQCSAMTIVDKENDLQVMVHLFPGYGEKSNMQIFEHIFSRIKDKSNLELSIIPGYAGGVSSQFLTDVAKKFAPKSKLNYYNFPESDVVRIFQRGLVLKDGKLSCCDHGYFTNRNINPLDSIVACRND